MNLIIINAQKKKKCPEKYNKLIINKGKCIDECLKDNIYIFEYNNICYEIQIINETYIINNITTDILINKY